MTQPSGRMERLGRAAAACGRVEQRRRGPAFASALLRSLPHLARACHRKTKKPRSSGDKRGEFPDGILPPDATTIPGLARTSRGRYFSDRSSMASLPAMEIVLICLASRFIFFRSIMRMRLLSKVRK